MKKFPLLSIFFIITILYSCKKSSNTNDERLQNDKEQIALKQLMEQFHFKFLASTKELKNPIGSRRKFSSYTDALNYYKNAAGLETTRKKSLLVMGNKEKSLLVKGNVSNSYRVDEDEFGQESINFAGHISTNCSISGAIGNIDIYTDVDLGYSIYASWYRDYNGDKRYEYFQPLSKYFNNVQFAPTGYFTGEMSLGAVVETSDGFNYKILETVSIGDLVLIRDVILLNVLCSFTIYGIPGSMPTCWAYYSSNGSYLP